eukprot:828271-Karenia_brevis.AAC.1
MGDMAKLGQVMQGLETSTGSQGSGSGQSGQMFGNGSTQAVGAQTNALSQQEQDNLVDKLGSVVQKALNSNAQSSKDNDVGSGGSVATSC